MSCTCAESRLYGERNDFRAHDCAYVKARNALIPLAERYADKHAQSDTTEWSQIFCRRMNDLMKQNGRSSG